MHSGMRRVPAERARHAKRLGHASESKPPVLLANADSSAPQSQQSTTASSKTSSAASSSAQSSSSAPPSSSSSSSSSHAPSSTTSSPTSSATVPTSTQSFTTSPSPVSTFIEPVTLTSPTPSPTSAPQSAASTSHGLSGGALAGIIAGSVIVGVALVVFLIRKTYLRRRETKRISWNAAPGLGADFLDEPKPIDIDERSSSPTSIPQRSAPLSPFEARSNPMYSTPHPPMQHPAMPPYAIPTPPSATYNNPAFPTQPYPLTYNPAAHPMAYGAAGTGMSPTLHAAGAQRAPMEVTVKCSFVPTLPDELSITTGERIFVVEQYDDGWDLCMNARGDRGMVPHECLEHVPSDQLDAGWKNVRRLSSLNPDGRRF